MTTIQEENKTYPLTQLQTFSISDAVAAYRWYAKEEVEKYPNCKIAARGLERAEIAYKAWSDKSHKFYDVWNDKSAEKWHDRK
tara:strand:+ start:580 stop:828 length:249 start_codon:yes stop_codon:yes gene_type:complete